MVKNVGLIDKIVRFVVAAGLFAFGAFHLSTGWWWVGLIGLVPLTTGLVGYCPVWHLTGIQTIRVKKL